MNTQVSAVITLIEQHGLIGLCETDGCPCLTFEVHRISVDVSCYKSDHSIRVYSGCPDVSDEDLVRVLEVVKRKFTEHFGDFDDVAGYKTSLRSWQEDRKQARLDAPAHLNHR